MKAASLRDTPAFRVRAQVQVSVVGRGCEGPIGKGSLLWPFPPSSRGLSAARILWNFMAISTWPIQPSQQRFKVKDRETQIRGDKVTCPRSHTWEMVEVSV